MFIWPPYLPRLNRRPVLVLFDKRALAKLNKIYSMDSFPSLASLHSCGIDFYFLSSMYPKLSLQPPPRGQELPPVQAISASDTIGCGGFPSVCIIATGFFVPFTSKSASDILEFAYIKWRDKVDVEQLVELQRKLEGFKKFLQLVRKRREDDMFDR